MGWNMKSTPYREGTGTIPGMRRAGRSSKRKKEIWRLVTAMPAREFKATDRGKGAAMVEQAEKALTESEGTRDTGIR